MEGERSRHTKSGYWRKDICKSCDIPCEYRNFFVSLHPLLVCLYRGITHARMKKKPRKYKSEEHRLREKAHQFGQPGGNPIGNPSMAANIREFYRWVENVATKKELDDYVKNENNPWNRIHFVELWLANSEVSEVFAMTNQTHGAPKQPIEVQSLPKVEISLFRKKHE